MSNNVQSKNDQNMINRLLNTLTKLNTKSIVWLKKMELKAKAKQGAIDEAKADLEIENTISEINKTHTNG